MRYRVTCLTPVLVGDGRKLAPIDYMVWRDQINVLDQTRIFRLMAKGPRLEGYLADLKRADKLEFAKWGGFAQNYADRRIPFESPSAAPYWNRATGESVHIPTFASGIRGPYLPGTALKGALRSGMLFSQWRDGLLADLASRMQGDRPPRRPAEAIEEQALGPAGSTRMRLVSVADSDSIDRDRFKVYLLRTSTLLARANGYALGWKQSPRGNVDGGKPEDSTPSFAEMAPPGTTFEGEWWERGFFEQPEVRRAVRWPESFDRSRLFEAANDYAARLLELHKQYAGWTGLQGLAATVASLETRLAESRAAGACLLNIGWGGGLLSKSGWLDTANPDYRKILQQFAQYNRALASNLPFPKTRRIVFLSNRPASLPGWVLLEVSQ